MGQIGKHALAALAFGVLFVVAGCETAPSNGGGIEAEYKAARKALEAGRYAEANRRYAALAPRSGPLQPNIQLEYAHSLLRAGDHARAAATAEALAASEPRARGAAMAVTGAARHEMGLAALTEGDGASGKAELQKARDAMLIVLKDHPDLDPLGALAGRSASIKVRLDRM